MNAVVDNQPKTLSIPALAASLLAFATYGYASGSYIDLALLGFALAASKGLQARFAGAFQTWVVRLVLLAIQSLMVVNTDLVKIELAVYQLVVGHFCAAELVVRCYMGVARIPLNAAAIGLSGVVFAVATRVFDATVVPWITPPFFLFFALALRDLRPRPVAKQRAPLAAVAGWRGIAALVALLFIGELTSAVLFKYRAEITTFFLRFTPRPDSEEADSSGLMKVPDLRQAYDLKLSPERVLSIAGEIKEHHFRGISYDTYRDGIWGPNHRKYESASGWELCPDDNGVRIEVTRLVDSFRILLIPLHAQGIQSPRRQIQWARDAGGPLRTWAKIEPPYSYDVIQSDRPAFQGPFCNEPDFEHVQKLLEVPDTIEPGVRELAKKISGELRDPWQKIDAVRTFLIQNNEYSLKIDPGAGDPVSNFLLKKLPGHCQFFASSTVILLRCMGIPARYVVGYYAHEKEGEGETIVRQRDAHAWVEVWLPPRGWITVDPTPPRGLPDQDKLELPWWVRLREGIGKLIERARLWVLSLTAGEQVLIVAGLVVAVLVLQTLNVLLRRRRAAGRAAAVPHEFGELIRQFEQLLNKNGLPCPEALTWEEHILAVEQDALLRGKLPAAPALDFVREYNRVRFGKADGNSRETMLRALEALRAAVQPGKNV